MLERLGRHDEQRAPVDADTLADCAGKLLIAGMGSDQSKVRRPYRADIGLVEHLVAAKSGAVTAEASKHAARPFRIGKLDRRRCRQMLRPSNGLGVQLL